MAEDDSGEGLVIATVVVAAGEEFGLAEFDRDGLGEALGFLFAAEAEKLLGRVLLELGKDVVALVGLGVKAEPADEAELVFHVSGGADEDGVGD